MFTSVRKTNHVYGPIDLLTTYIVNKTLICKQFNDFEVFIFS